MKKYLTTKNLILTAFLIVGVTNVFYSDYQEKALYDTNNWKTFSLEDVKLEFKLPRSSEDKPKISLSDAKSKYNLSKSEIENLKHAYKIQVLNKRLQHPSDGFEILILKHENWKERFNTTDAYYLEQIENLKNNQLYRQATSKLNSCPEIKIKTNSSLYVETKTETNNVYTILSYCFTLNKNLIVVQVLSKKDSYIAKSILDSIKQL